MAADLLQDGIPRIPEKVRLLDFAPDLDSTTPGILIDASNLVPTAKGYRTYPRLTRLSENELPDPCLGAFASKITDVVLLAGTANKLYYLSGTTLTDSGLTPNATTGRWRFDLYANEIIATNGTDPPYKYNGTTFSNLGGSPPVASIVQATTYSLFLIEANSSNWRSSLNSAIWTPSIATQTVTGTIRAGEGTITAAHRLRGGIAIYKAKHISFGRFSGPPFFWDFGNGVSDEVGAPGQEAVANLGDIHYFPGPDDFYSFDGYSLRRIPNNLKEWFFDTVNQYVMHAICARWDQRRSLIFWHFPSKNASPETVLDSWICLNLRTGKWSADTQAELVDMPVFSPIPSGRLTYDSLTKTYPTYGDMNFFYGDLKDRSVEVSAAFKASDHGLYIYDGFGGQSYFVSNDFGDRESLYQVTMVRPHYQLAPADGATIQALNQSAPGETPVAGPSASLKSGKFDLINTARLQRFKHIGNSDYEIVALEVDAEFAGEQ